MPLPDADDHRPRLSWTPEGRPPTPGWVQHLRDPAGWHDRISARPLTEGPGSGASRFWLTGGSVAAAVQDVSVNDGTSTSPALNGAPGSAPVGAGRGSGRDGGAGSAGLVAELREHLARWEAASGPGPCGEPSAPAWRRATPGEARWPVSVAMAAAIALQVALPNELSVASRFLLPAVEAAILVVLLAINPRRIDRVSRPLRLLGLALIAVASLANGYSAVVLILGLVNGSQGKTAGPLLASGGAIYLTNVLVFALWYWELDRGGPASRALALRTNPDFLFPQMATPHIADPDWEPRFADYLYVSFTNATAFSPTDTMPLTRWAKMTMLLQSTIALVTIALVIARVVNILGP